MTADEALRNAGYELNEQEGDRFIEYINKKEKTTITFFPRDLEYVKDYIRGDDWLPPNITEKEHFAINLMMNELGAM